MPARLLAEAIPDSVRDLCNRLTEAGFRSWIVGGCVRDLLMGKAVSDWDLTTDATPKQVQRTFRRTVPTGIAHGTVTVLHRGGQYEVTTLRGEGDYLDGRRPESVHFVSDIEEDLARRDFTVNAIAFSPLSRELVDPWKGQEDLSAGVLRAVRDPRERFQEDGLRVLRAARFVATLELALDPATEAAIGPTLETFRKVSPERVHEEWSKLMRKAQRPSRAFEVMKRTGMLRVTAPDLDELDSSHFDFALRRIDSAPREFGLRVAALVLDLDANLDEWMRSMRFSNDERERVAHVVACSQTLRDPEMSSSWSDPELRRYLQRASRTRLPDIVSVVRADRRAGAIGDPTPRGEDDLNRLERRFAEQNAAPLGPGELRLSGGDIMRILESRPGRHVGQILNALVERTLDDPSLNRADRLAELVPELAATFGVSPGETVKKAPK